MNTKLSDHFERSDNYTSFLQKTQKLTHLSPKRNMITTLLSRMEIYERIRSIRLAKNLTQEYMAEQLDIDVANYGRLERGKSKIDIERLKRIADILSVSLEEMVSEKETNQFLKQERAINLLEEMLTEIKIINQKLK
jgi:transcriptional regulator with XRE-family HTH domain